MRYTRKTTPCVASLKPSEHLSLDSALFYCAPIRYRNISTSANTFMWFDICNHFESYSNINDGSRDLSQDYGNGRLQILKGVVGKIRTHWEKSYTVCNGRLWIEFNTMLLEKQRFCLHFSYNNNTQQQQLTH